MAWHMGFVLFDTHGIHGMVSKEVEGHNYCAGVMIWKNRQLPVDGKTQGMERFGGGICSVLDLKEHLFKVLRVNAENNINDIFC